MMEVKAYLGSPTAIRRRARSNQVALGRNSLYVLYPPPMFDAEKPDCRKMRVAK